MRQFTPGEFKRLSECATEYEAVQQMPLGEPFLYASQVIQKHGDLKHGMKVIYCIRPEVDIMRAESGRIYREEKVKF